MNIQGLLLQPLEENCPYIEGIKALNETMLVQNIDTQGMEHLLSMGFRHFGEVFFRPICTHCRLCIPIRLPVDKYVPSPSVRRLFNRNKHLQVTLEQPVPSEEAYEVYCRHKKRFKRDYSESYDAYLRSFYFPYPFNRSLCVRDGDRLVAVSHLDFGVLSISAIYTYFDEEYNRFSPGKFVVYRLMELAREYNLRWVYLGFYVPGNRHMNYKVLFKPNEVMVRDHEWIDYLDAAGNEVNPLPEPEFTHLADYDAMKKEAGANEEPDEGE